MPTAKESAEEFAKLWTLETLVDRQEMPPTPNLPESVRKTIDNMASNMVRRRKEGRSMMRREDEEYVTASLQRLEGVLSSAQVTEPCKQYLIFIREGDLMFDVSSYWLVSLEKLGINISAGRYGIFDAQIDQGPIEKSLLDVCDLSVTLYPLNKDPRLIAINSRWHDAFQSTYASLSKS
ncbi:hypothetical protein HYV83_04315 [Candidatus Woesearchaeota archaeon]|nr:hypothetical protein [Candidatus Woesearchaeota archaeon]